VLDGEAIEIEVLPGEFSRQNPQPPPYTRHPTPDTHPTPYILIPQSSTLDPKPLQARNVVGKDYGSSMSCLAGNTSQI